MIKDVLITAIGSAGVRIQAGPNKGLKWSLANLRESFWKGTYEAERVRVVAALIQPGGCVWDVGAHRGYVTMVCARQVGPAGSVYAFEPSQRNLRFLRRHVQMNRLSNVHVSGVALSSHDGSRAFGGSGSRTLKLGGAGEEVTVRSLRTLLESGDYQPPTVMKIDVEGAEADLLEGAGVWLDRIKPLMLIAVHSLELYHSCLATLKGHNYQVLESPELSAARENKWEGLPDPDILAVAPGRTLPEEARTLYMALT